MLFLHYVPGGHGTPVSPKCSAPWDFVHFLIVLSIIVTFCYVRCSFCHGSHCKVCHVPSKRVLACDVYVPSEIVLQSDMSNMGLRECNKHCRGIHRVSIMICLISIGYVTRYGKNSNLTSFSE